MVAYLPPGITTSDIGGVSGTGADNRIPTFTDATNIQGEANLTFDGTDLVIASGSLQVRTIDYSDGDLAMTIADGGGVTFAEDVTFTTGKTIKFPDNGSNAGAKAVFGTGDDLQIFHDHTNSYIDNSTGYLILGSDSDVRITKGAASEIMASFVPDGAVNLYHDNSVKFYTAAAGAIIDGKLTMAGTTPSIWIGDGGTEDTALVFNGAAQDYHIGLDDSGDVLRMGKGYTLGTTTAFTIGSTPSVGFFRAAGANNLISIRPGTTLTAANAEASMIYSEQGTVNWDNASGGDATIAIQSVMALRTQAWAGASNTLTFSEAATLWIEGAPTDSDANVTITNAYALWVDSGTSRFDGDITSQGNIYMGQGAVQTKLFVNENSNAAMTSGITVNQGAADDPIFELKSTDIAHGLLGYSGVTTETDTFYSISKLSGSLGGTEINSIAEDAATTVSYRVWASGGTAHTTKDVNTIGLVDFIVMEHDGSNGRANITSDGTIFSLRAYTGGGFAPKWAVDEDGDTFSPTTNAHIAFSDNYDDALLIRAFDHIKSNAGAKGMVRDKWDDFVHYKEQDLIDAGVLGAPLSQGGLTNNTQLAKLHNGAIWQGYTRQMALQEEVNELKTRLLALEGGK
jgi:hypothetical protein